MKRWNSLKVWGGLLLAVGLLFCQTGSVLGASTTPLSVSLGFDFASGDYGTDQTTDSTRIPLTIGYTPSDRLDFELVIPYLYQSNNSAVSLGGMHFSVQNSGTTGGGMGGGGGTANSGTSQSGLGDITLTTGYVLLAEKEQSPMFRPLVYVKFPTADENKGLGTGAYDFGGGLSLGKGVGNWFTYAEALYIVPGSTASFNPDNYWTYLVSASYALSERLSYGVDLSGATAAFAGGSNALYAEASLNYWTSQTGSIGGYVSKGLSTGSADYALGFYGAINF